MCTPCNTPGKTRSQAITDIIESVALEEKALSHILTAEAEKLKKIVCDRNVSPEFMLKTNKSVESVIRSISRLEMILQIKLDLFGDCICP